MENCPQKGFDGTDIVRDVRFELRVLIVVELHGGPGEDTGLKVSRFPKNTARSQPKCKASPSTWAKLMLAAYQQVSHITPYKGVSRH